MGRPGGVGGWRIRAMGPRRGRSFSASLNEGPTLTAFPDAAADLSGPIEDAAFTMTHAAMLSASDASDPDGDDLLFRVESVANGTMTKGGIAVTNGVTTIEAGESFVWTPNAGGSLSVGTFRVVDEHGVASDSAIGLTLDVLIATGLTVRIDYVQGADSAVLYDLSGNGWHGALFGAPFTPSWAVGGGLTFVPTKLVTFAAGLPAQLVTNMQCFTNTYPPAEYSHAFTPWLIKSDGRPVVQASFGDTWGPAQKQHGNVIWTVVQHTTTGKIYWGESPSAGFQPGANDPQDPPGASIRLGVADGGAFPWTGTHYYWLGWNFALSDSQVASQARWMKNVVQARGVTVGDTAPTDKHVAFLGDSLTAGVSVPDQDYPRQARLSLTNPVRITNLGRGGLSSTSLDSAVAAALTDLFALTTDQMVAVVQIGTNDLLQSVAVATIISNITSIVTKLRTAGADDVIVVTPPQANWAAQGRSDGLGDEDHVTLCEALIAGDTGADACANTTGNANIGYAGNTGSGTYYIDGIHLTQAGSAITAAAVVASLATLGIT